MRIVKPSWVRSKEPLFSCDVHPDGEKFATGGQGEGTGRITIWHLAPVARQKAEKSTFKKTIATLEHHQGCVNCVRWSGSGQFLGSASDDKVVMIWGAVQYEGSHSESYKCLHILRGHDGDVLDLAWSVDDYYLASSSIDNSVIVWNCRNFPEKLTTIKGHNGMVKGVVWDPIGRYLATQSADKTLRVWRMSDWQEEAKISDPFSKCGGTTTVLRIGWSPDGQYIVSSHAMNNEGPVAKIIEREDWKARMDFVGHRRAIESVRFNPHLFHYNKRPVSCVAIAGRDSSISVWLTALKRPLFVLHDVFTSSVLDMSWTPDGYGLVVCSLDGSLAYLELSSAEIGKTLTPQQTMSLRSSLYGSLNLQEKLTIIENPDLLEDDKQQNGDGDSSSSDSEEPMDTSDELSTEASSKSRESSSQPRHQHNGFSSPSNGGFPNAFSDLNGYNKKENILSSIPNKLSLRFEKPSSSASSPSSNIVSKQVETTTKDGRRRIMPITLKEVPVVSQKPAQSTKRVLLTPVSNCTPSQKTPNTSEVIPSDSKNSTISLGNIPVKLSNRIQSIGNRPHSSAQQKLESKDKLFAAIAGCRVEVDNIQNTVSFTLQSKTWKTVLYSEATSLSAGENYLVLGCQDGTLHVYDKQGVLAFPLLNVGRAIVKSAVSGDYVAVVTTAPSLAIWNVSEKKNVLKDESLSSFLSENRSVCSLEVTKEGNVTIGLSNKTSYCYSYSLSAWMLIGHHQLDASWYKELQTNRQQTTPAQVLSPLLQSYTNNPDSTSNRDKLHLNTVLMLEQQILVAENLSSFSECRLWLSSLVRYMTMQQEEDRLHSLLQRLLSSPQQKLFGDDKLTVLKELLKIVATNVSCQRVYSDFKQQVDWAESKR